MKKMVIHMYWKLKLKSLVINITKQLMGYMVTMQFKLTLSNTEIIMEMTDGAS